MNNIYWIWIDNDFIRCGFDNNMFEEKNGFTNFLKESEYYEEGSYHYEFRLGGFFIYWGEC